MKELKEIIDGIASSLNMTVDSLVKAYPHLRTEYSWYYATKSVEVFAIMSMLLIVAVIAIGVPSIYTFCETNPEKHSRKLIKNGVVLFVIMFIIVLISNVVKGFVCPDILIINEIVDTIGN